MSLLYITKTFNLDDITNENNKEHNEKWPYIIPDRLYRILIIGGSGSGETNALLNLIMEQDDIHKIYLYAKDLSEPKHEFLIKKCKDVGIKYCNDPNSFIECSNRMDDVYQNIVDYNPSKKRKILIAVDDMIADIMTNKKFQTRIKELFIRCRKVTCFYHSVLFFYPERCQIKFNTLFDYENQQQQRITKYCD